MLTIGNTSAPVFKPKDKAKVPETLFFDIDQVSTVECMGVGNGMVFETSALSRSR